MSAPAAERSKINPFLIPGREDAPMSTLCPWKDAAHTDLYIEIDNYGPALADFQSQFTTLSLLEETSRLAVVTGESGCGKSALRNHCAHWLKGQLGEPKCEIVDLSREIDLTHKNQENRVIDIRKRIAHVSERLVKRLAKLDLIDGAASDAFARAKTPDLIYADLATAMENKGQPEVVLILLLPSADLPAEIEQYASMSGPRIVFFAESSYLRHPQLNSIVADNDMEVPPATMEVGALSSTDIKLFIETRYEQRAKDGVFPRLDDDILDQLTTTKDMSVARLQQHMTGLYTYTQKYTADYTNDTKISMADHNRYMLWKQGMMG
jgi:energy-coupling factor transporter ATP-binding protein EcfA2